MTNAWDRMLQTKANRSRAARAAAARKREAKYGTPCSSIYRTKGGTEHKCTLHAGHKGYHERADRMGFWS